MAITPASFAAKQRILSACVRLFLEKGYKRTTVAEILKAANVSASTFQNIFHAKDGVLIEFVQFMFGNQFNIARKITGHDLPPVYVYALDDNDQYSILTRTMTCSTGLRDTPTPTGEFTYTGPGARWHYFKKWKCWAQYAYYIDGDIMFHSVLYNSDDESTLVKSSVRNLGRRASHGCVRLSVEDARWLWNNCPGGTHVIVY